jgi:hypothetical protein
MPLFLQLKAHTPHLSAPIYSLMRASRTTCLIVDIIGAITCSSLGGVQAASHIGDEV